MINIQLKERQERKLSELVFADTFKIPESSFVFMKIDVEGLTTLMKQHPDTMGKEDLKPLKVQIPEGKTPVACLSTGKTQFMQMDEKVQIVNLLCTETLDSEKGG